MSIRENFKFQDTTRSGYFNKKINLNSRLKQKKSYGLKLKRKKTNAKPRSNKHIATIRHNNKIAFT